MTTPRVAAILLVETGNTNDSEFKRFIDTLRTLGIKFSINHGPTKKKWQRVISEAGFNLTALACTIVEVGEVDYLFSNGQPHWTDDDKGHGPAGVLLLSRNTRSKEIQNRVCYDPRTGDLLSETGLLALQRQYSF